MKIKKALCLLTAFAATVSLGTVPVFADEVQMDMEFQDVPNEAVEASTDIPDFDFSILTPDADGEVDNNGDVSVMGLIPSSDGKAGTLYINAANGTENNTFIVKRTGSTSYTKTGPATFQYASEDKESEIEITPVDGFTITKIDITQGRIIAAKADGQYGYTIKENNKIQYDTLLILPDEFKEGNAYKITGGDLFKTVAEWKNANSSNDVADYKTGKESYVFDPATENIAGSGDFDEADGRKGIIELTVETAPAAVGTVTVNAGKEDNKVEDAIFTIGGTTSSTFKTLSNDLTSYINDNHLTVGKTVSFTYDKALVDNVVVATTEGSDSKDGTYANGTAIFTIPGSEQTVTLTVNFKEKAAGLNITVDGGALSASQIVTGVSVNWGDKVTNYTKDTYDDITNNAKNYYAGTVVSVTFTLKSGATIANHPSIGTLSGNTVNNVTLGAGTTTLNVNILNDIAPILRSASYKANEGVVNSSEVGKIETGYEKGVAVMAAWVQNIADLSDEVKNSGQMTMTVNCTHTTNPKGLNQEGFLTNTQSIAGCSTPESTCAGIVISPKDDADKVITYDYDLTMTTNLHYRHTTGEGTVTSTTTTSIEGAGVQD